MSLKSEKELLQKENELLRYRSRRPASEDLHRTRVLEEVYTWMVLPTIQQRQLTYATVKQHIEEVLGIQPRERPKETFDLGSTVRQIQKIRNRPKGAAK